MTHETLTTLANCCYFASGALAMLSLVLFERAWKLWRKRSPLDRDPVIRDLKQRIDRAKKNKKKYSHLESRLKSYLTQRLYHDVSSAVSKMEAANNK